MVALELFKQELTLQELAEKSCPGKSPIAWIHSSAIFITDQKSQFTSNTFTKILQDQVVQISMNGRGRWSDNVRIQWLWRTVKYKDIYLQGYEILRSLKRGMDEYFRIYNQHRFHQALKYETPDQRSRLFFKMILTA